MLRKNTYGFLVLLMGLNVLLASCDGCTPPPPKPEPKTDTAVPIPAELLGELKKTFFSVPSPVEIATLIEQKGYQFEQDKLVPTANVDKYVSEARQAVMLGIYGADLGYATIFKQKQPTTEYFAASQKLARALHLDHIITPTLIERLEKNQSDKDSTMNIVNEAYADMNDNLKEKQRYDIAALVIAGGWIEALYLSTQYTAAGDQDIRTRVAEQVYSLNNLIAYLDKFGDKRAPINDLKADLSRLKDAFNAVKENKGSTTTNKDDSGKMVIGSSTTLAMDDATLNNISTITKEIRTKHTAL